MSVLCSQFFSSVQERDNCEKLILLDRMYARRMGDAWHFPQDTARAVDIICYINIKCMYVYVYL